MTARLICGCTAAAACLAAVAGCASSGPAHHGASPGLSAAYLRIALPANHKLDTAESGYARNCRIDLAAAEAALRAQAAIERGFDRQLSAIQFTPAIEATASALIQVNQVRIALTLRQAGARSIRSLLAFTGAHKAADAEVEAQVKVIRAQLGLPPPESS